MPMMPPTTPSGPLNGFLLIAGVTFFSFAAGFSVCLFDIDTVPQCVAVAEYWADRFRNDIGAHIVAWGTAIVKETLHNHPLLPGR